MWFKEKVKRYCCICGVLWIPDSWMTCSSDKEYITKSGERLYVCWSCYLWYADKIQKLVNDE